ncbi:MAG: CPBP family intramembrane metalloprotease [Chthoniobacterales bacterium]|jgi:membrane protease YdiL (CAAX protease family)|nr:CPBP family intramembrane metalloprotease [Chthoniobacterales bacterium]
MPAYLKVLVYLVAALTIGALVAPPIFWAGQYMAAEGLSDWLSGFPFHRVLNRCLQVSLLVFLWPALKWIGLRRPSDLGFQKNACGARDAIAGFALAAAGVALVSALSLFAGLLAWRPDPDIAAIGRIVLTAGAVALVEETVFRGVILGLCLWSLSARASVFLSSLLFAVLHFLKPAKTRLAPDAVQWWSGFSETFSFAGNLPPAAVLAFGLASLFLAGWVLGQCAVRTRSLWLPIGVHAGWVLGVQTANLFFKSSVADGTSHLPWAGPSLVSGAVPTGLLPLAGLVLVGWMTRFYLLHVSRHAVPRPA